MIRHVKHLLWLPGQPQRILGQLRTLLQNQVGAIVVIMAVVFMMLGFIYCAAVVIAKKRRNEESIPLAQRHQD